MGTLIAYKYPTPLFLKLADHTYVECGTGARGWSCWGGKTNGTAFHRGAGSTLQANAIAEPDERAGISCYLINGVCHQAANRILYPARILVTGARGYGVSEALFGPYGRPRGFLGFCNAPFNKHEHVSGDLPECEDDAVAMSGQETTTSPEDRKYADMTANVYAETNMGPLMRADSKDPADLLAEITDFQLKLFSLMMEFRLQPSPAMGTLFPEMIEHRTRVEKTRFAIEQEFSKGGVSVDEFTTAMNDQFVDFQRDSANTLSETDYQNLFGVSRDEEVWLGDPSIAAEAFSEFQSSSE